MIEEVDLDEWIKEVKRRTAGLRRPKRPIRTLKSRSPAKSDALARAVIRAWKQALESGELIEEEDGSYTICPKKRNRDPQKD